MSRVARKIQAPALRNVYPQLSARAAHCETVLRNSWVKWALGRAASAPHVTPLEASDM